MRAALLILPLHALYRMRGTSSSLCVIVEEAYRRRSENGFSKRSSASGESAGAMVVWAGAFPGAGDRAQAWR
jgi:hypothetical protein